MPDTIDDQGQLNPDMTSVALSPAQLKAWIDGQQRRLDAGLPLGKQGIPPGYKVDGGKIVEQNAWDTWGKGAAIGMGAGIAGGFGAGYLNNLVSGAGAVSGAASPATAGGAYLAPSEVSIASSSGLGGATIPTVTGAVNTAASSVPSAAAAAGLPDWLKTAQNVGDALSSASAGRAEGRLAEGQANQAQNRAAVDLYNTELNAPRTIARNAVKGDVLANAQDVHIDHPSTIPDFNITGGLRPSMFSDATRQTGRNISDAAAHTPIPSPTAPILPDLPQAGGLDSFLNTASTISGLSRAVPPSAWGAIGRGLKGLFA